MDSLPILFAYGTPSKIDWVTAISTSKFLVALLAMLWQDSHLMVVDPLVMVLHY